MGKVIIFFNLSLVNNYFKFQNITCKIGFIRWIHPDIYAQPPGVFVRENNWRYAA